MSVVVGVKKNDSIVLATDSFRHLGSSRFAPEIVNTSKVSRIANTLFGVAGWSVYHYILRDYAKRQKFSQFANEHDVYQFFQGLWDELQQGRFGFVNHQCNSESSPFVDLDSSFLIATDAGIYTVTADLCVLSCERYWAIGVGSDFAFGAMYYLYDREDSADRIAEMGVRAAIQFCTHCGGESIIHRLR